MSSTSFLTRQQIKRDTSANWALATNFTPLDGEIIYYTDLHKIKVGDGTTKVNNLSFIQGDLHFITNTGSSAGVWTGSDPTILSYYDGLMIMFYSGSYAGGSSSTTLNINGLGAKKVYYASTTVLTSTQGPTNSYQMLIYDSSLDSNAGGFKVQYRYSANDRVSQSRSTSTSWRKIILSYQGTSSPTDTATAQTSVVYDCDDISAQPSTGTIHANVFDGGISYLTSAPSADNTDGIKIVVLTSEPATKYDGYLYIVTS